MRIGQTCKINRSFTTGIFLAMAALPVVGQSVHRAKVKMDVGPTVQVSRDLPQVSHYENLTAADPEHVERLLSCSMVYPPQAGVPTGGWQNCYASFDGGKTWQVTMKATEGWLDGDPTAIYGHNDTVYVVTLRVKNPDRPKDKEDPDAQTFQNSARTVVFKSTDAGRTWSESSSFPFIDREFIYLDKTGGKYDGRLYIIGQVSVHGMNGQQQGRSMQMFRSLDGGKTFLGPVVAQEPEGAEFGIYVGTGAMLSDGTAVIMYGLTKKGRRHTLEPDPELGPNSEMYVISSKDGGERFSNSVKVTDYTFDRPRSEGGLAGELAVDPGSAAFKDRLYLAFSSIISGRIQVLLCYSADKGKTWSKPIVVNDDRTPAEEWKGPDHMLPSVTVNKEGVVLVTWYDRREARDNMGWRVRAAASLDGGETFSASIPVTGFANSYPQDSVWPVTTNASSDDSKSLISMDAGINSFFISAGHTSGLVADADGVFHPTWVDNHTGVSQLWTSTIKVNGPVVKHGAPDLASLDDISSSVAVDLFDSSFDRKTGTMTFKAQLRNTSAHTVTGQVKVRVLSLESPSGIPEITNADNGQNGVGAVWDFSSLLPGGTLEPLKVSTSRTLTFHLSDVRPLGSGKDFKPGLISLDARVLGKTEEGSNR